MLHNLRVAAGACPLIAAELYNKISSDVVKAPAHSRCEQCFSEYWKDDERVKFNQ